MPRERDFDTLGFILWQVQISQPKTAKTLAPLRPSASLRGTLRIAKWLGLREALRAGLGVFGVRLPGLAPSELSVPWNPGNPCSGCPGLQYRA